MAAEAERVANRHIDPPRSWSMWDIIQIALMIGRVQVNCRRKQVILDRQHSNQRLDRASGADQVAELRFARADWHLIRALAEETLDGLSLSDIARTSAGCMHTDIVNITRRQ